MIEAEIGTVVTGIEIGKTPSRRYIRSLCKICGIIWWGDYSHIRSGGALRYCRICNKQNFSMQARLANKKTQPKSKNINGENTENDCVHHWIISEAAGAKSDGVCKKCGEERAFNNSVEAEGVQQINLISKRADVKRYIREQIRRENDTEF